MGGACGGHDAVIDSSGVEDFVKALRSAVTQLLTKLNVPLERVTARFIQHTHSQSYKFPCDFISHDRDMQLN